MKFNGKNIIFDDDITLTSEGFEGEKLADVLGGLRSKTSKLEKYMKWLYQYGGVGGSGGGGGGSQSGYSLYVTVGGVQVTGGTLNLSSGENEWYDLVVKIQNPEGATVRVGYSYYYKNDSGTKIKAGNDINTNPIVLNSSNSYTYTAKIRLNTNDSLIIDAQDDLFGIDKQINCNVIVNNYTFNAFLAKENGDAWTDSGRGAEIFTEETGSKDHCNLNIAIDYDIAIPVDTTYNWSFVIKDKIIQGSGNLSQGAGRLMIPLIFENNAIDKFEANESDAGYYSVSLSINVDMSSVGQISGKPWTKTLNFNLIPQNLYLLVSSATGTIYADRNTSADRYEFNPGIIGFHLNSYRGNDGGTTCTIEYRVDNGPWKVKSSTIRTEVDITDVNITDTKTLEGHEENEHWIDFRLTSGYNQYPQGEEYIRYWFYVKPLESNVDFPWADGDSTRAGHFNIYRNGVYGGPTFSGGLLVGDNLKSLHDLNGGAPFLQSTSNKPIVIDDITYPSTGLYTTVINIGLQYSEINSETGAIFTAIKGNEDETYLTIKQNSIQFGTHATVNYYLPKVAYEDFSKTEGRESRYHLLSIVQRLVSKTGNNSLYEITVFVDGVIEGASRNYVSNPLNFKSFTLNPCNCYLNLFEVSYLTWTESMQSGVEDLNIYQYWLKYREMLALGNGPYDINILSFVNRFTVTDGGTVVTEDRDSVANIATMCGVPTLVMTIRDDNDSALSKILAGYDENDELKFDVSIEWSDGVNKLAPVMLPTAMPNAQFVMALQGSSTKKYKCKNWNLGLVNNSAEDKNTVPRYLFSPNFSYPTEETINEIEALEDEEEKLRRKKEYWRTFLPEEEFTLKADVVDSSHSNNTSIGRFVNDITTKFTTGQSTGMTFKLENYIKNCLDGFPILVYICLSKTANGATTNKYYYQGVYNFNLGRTSYYNLGYKDIRNFVGGTSGDKLLLGNAGNSFTFYQVGADEDNIKDGLLVAEIQGNSPYFDFSQYDKTILFNQGPNDHEYMFGDIEKATQSMTDSEAQDILSNLVKLTSRAGGYLFENILRKSISYSPDDLYGYSRGYNTTKTVIGENGKEIEVPANLVPNYKKNFIKKNISGVYTFLTEGPDKDTASATALGEFIGTDDDDPKPAFFDYQSLSEYYTICMAFGLVDSVQKNMNIKSWDANKEADGTYKGKFYAAFYDMDTSLGINNAGRDVTYFAFSDYWEHDDSEKTADGVVTPKPISIYRDYSPKNKSDEEGGGDYYDTASSYLFAVAKYAIYTDEFGEDKSTRTTYWPKRLWALWRTTENVSGEQNAGCLSSAKKFMENYFQNNLGKVSIPLINMNYRNKYFVFTSEEGDVAGSFSARNFNMFNGTRIHKAEDWLNGRLHILDAYFNLPDSNSPIQYFDENGNFVDVPSGSGALTEPVNAKWNYKYALENNPDITVLRDIFAQGTAENSGSGTIDVRVKAREFTPLFIKTPTKAFRYLLDANTQYKIYQDLSGLQAFRLGGSVNWVELDSINNIPITTLTVNSKYLEKLSGSEKVLNIYGKDIILPSLKDLILTGRNYELNFEGEGKINDRFANLVEVNFSGVKSCNAEITGSKLTTLSIGNILNGRINVSDCYDLEKLNMGEGTESKPSPQLQSLILNPVSESIRQLTWTRTGIQSMGLTNASTRGDSEFNLSYDKRVETISLTGFSKVNIQNCPNLKHISISDNENRGDKLTELTIIGCGTEVDEFHINSEENGVIDLTNCKYLKKCGGLSGMVNIKDVRFSKDATAEGGSTTVEVVPECFKNDNNLTYLSGSQIVITGTGTFINCTKFTMRESSGGSVTNLFVKAGVTSVASMFSVSGGGTALTLPTIKSFMEGGPSHWGGASSITNMSSMFHGQYGIQYTEANLKTDLAAGDRASLRLDLRNFTSLSTVTNMFSWTNMAAYHPHTLGFGRNATDISFQNFSIGVGTISICPSSFGSILPKILYLGPTDVNYTNPYRLLDNSGNRVSSANLSPYFLNPTKVRGLYGLSVDTSTCTRCNLTGFFGIGSTTRWPALTEIKTTFKSAGSGYVGITESGVNTLKVSSFYESFNFGTSATINLATFFNWSALLKGTGPFGNRKDSAGAYYAGCAKTKKTITMSDLKTLWTSILNSNITSLDFFFTDCTVTDADSNDLTTIFGATGSKLGKITTLAGAFQNFSIIRAGATTATPIIIGHFLSVFPNATNYTMCFRETSIGEQIPRDFFGKRQKDQDNSRSGKIFFTKVEPQITAKELGGVTVKKIWADDNDSIFEEGSVTKFNYKPAAMKLSYMFCETTWKRYGDDGSNDIKHSARCYRPENDTTEIERNYFEIGRDKFYDDEDNGFVKVDGKTAYYVKKTYTYNVIVSSEEQEDGTVINKWEQRTAEYYDFENVVTKGDENSEYYDLQGLRSDHVNEFNTISGTKLFNNLIDDPDNLFIAPDFFYPLSNTANSEISYIFSAGSSVPNENRLEGMIPEHLFKNCKSVSFAGIFTGLNITPRYWKTFETGGGVQEAFVYVPQNFTSYATLNNAFNFNLNVPAAGGDTSTYKKYYVMFKNSIPKITTTLSNSLPTSWPGQQGTWQNFGANGAVMGTHYNIMIDQASESEPIEGIDASYFSSLTYNNLVRDKLSWVLHGNLFKSSFLLEGLRMAQNSSGLVSDYVITTTNHATNATFISRGLILPSTGKSNLSGYNLIYFSTTGGLTISRSQIQGCTDAMATAYTTIKNLGAGSESYVHVIN